MITADTIDTLVIDDPDATGELDEERMHVLIEGFYHRRTPSLAHSACGIPIATMTAPLRRIERLEHPLCRRGCFSAFELAIADEVERRARAAADGD